MHKQDLALNNKQELIYHKRQPAANWVYEFETE